ncbi:hypothetical protein B296_00020126 [Ensete ventricosum]|uniref:Uncharacterized protein n=1 Tax=Ensete ventricosum TaxID=4639 RepID=A0A427A213_ENSVE|nr:hypothetical protein B296_00020126 [Ensete ventricosum]
MTLNSMTRFAWSRLAVVAPPLLSAPSSPSLISVGSVSNTLRGKATGWTFLCIPGKLLVLVKSIIVQIGTWASLLKVLMV